MDWQTWEPHYRAILAEFGWDEAADAASALALRGLLSDRDNFRNVGTELKYRAAATVVGCGPQLDSLQRDDLQGVVVSADGATTRLREIGIVPRVVVTDLDGDLEALRWAAENGSSIVVHAHGHNQDQLDLVKELGPFVAGTYQSSPVDELRPMRNLGGFTDGDRAVALCAHYGVREVRLAAFDFDAAPSDYSGTFDPSTKPAKLAWAKRIIGEFASATRITNLG